MRRTSRPRPRRAAPPRWTGEAQRLLDLLNALGSTTFRQLLWQRPPALDLSYAQRQTLFYVADHPGCHMGDVGKAFGVTLPAVTQIVDRLAEKHLVVRLDDPADRRVYILELTAPARVLVQELQAIQLRSLETVLARMTTEDRRRLVTGLEALVEAAVHAADPRTRSEATP